MFLLCRGCQSLRSIFRNDVISSTSEPNWTIVDDSCVANPCLPKLSTTTNNTARQDAYIICVIACRPSMGAQTYECVELTIGFVPRVACKREAPVQFFDAPRDSGKVWLQHVLVNRSLHPSSVVVPLPMVRQVEPVAIDPRGFLGRASIVHTTNVVKPSVRSRLCKLR